MRLVFTDSPIQAEGQHRGHAIVEQVFADVTSGPLAHLPPGPPATAAATSPCTCPRAGTANRNG